MRKMKRIAICRWVIFLILVGILSEVSAKADDWRLKKITITGNKTFKTSELKTLMGLKKKRFLRSPRFSSSKLRSDVSSLIRFYRSQGFFAVDIHRSVNRDSLKHRVYVELFIDEGERTRISAIDLSQKRSILETSILTKLKSQPHCPLLMSDLDSDADFLKSELANKGFLKAKVESQLEVDSSKSNARITFMINEGPLISVDTIILSGNKHVHSRVLTRELDFGKGDTLTIRKIRSSEQKLYKTNLFNFAQIEPIVEIDSSGDSSISQSSFPVKVAVQQADFFRIEGGVGYGTADGPRASLRTSYANVFQIGHSLTFNGKYSVKLQNAEIVYGVPWFLGLPLQFNNTAYLERHDDYKDTYYGVFHGIRFSVGRTTKFNLAYQFQLDWEEINHLRAKNDSYLPELPTKSIGLRVSYDSRNNFINPSKGILNSFETEVSGLTGKSNQFMKITDDFRLYWKVGSVVVGNGLKVGWIKTYGQSIAIPPQERFYIGGARSVRGFSENNLKVELPGELQSSNIMLTANLLDIRIPLFWWFQGAAFIDAGNVWQSVGYDKIFKDLRWAAGPGIRLNTPIAVARFDVGFKLNRKPGEGLYELHFDLGQPF